MLLKDSLNYMGRKVEAKCCPASQWITSSLSLGKNEAAMSAVFITNRLASGDAKE